MWIEVTLADDTPTVINLDHVTNIRPYGDSMALIVLTTGNVYVQESFEEVARLTAPKRPASVD